MAVDYPVIDLLRGPVDISFDADIGAIDVRNCDSQAVLTHGIDARNDAHLHLHRRREQFAEAFDCGALKRAFG